MPFAFPLLPYVLPKLSSSALFFILVTFTLLLSLSTAVLQWAVFALASLWSSQSVLGVMSGQGGIAVLVSGTQVFLAIFSALGAKAPSDETQSQSTLAGVGLWALGGVGTVGCIYAHRYLMRHPDYASVLAPLLSRREEAGNSETKRKDREVLKRVFKRNLLLEIAVAWVFVVTLVSCFLFCL